MSRLIGRRGSGGSGWTWVSTGPGPPRPRRRPPFWPAALLLGGIALLLGLSFLLVSAFRSDSGDQAIAQPGDHARATQAPAPSPTHPAASAQAVAPSQTGTPSASAPTAGPGPVRYRLALWSDPQQEWRFDDLGPEHSAYREGEAVPFMLRIDDARPGALYAISIRYDCALGGVNAYDYLTAYSRDRGAAPALAPRGPGREAPDDTAAASDDSSFLFDNAGGPREFQAWGATFAAPPSRPLPLALCRGQQAQEAKKEITLHLLAQDSTVWLLWGAHLASPLDWGAGNGAASAPGNLHLSAGPSSQRSAQLERSIQHALPYAAPAATP